MKTIMQLRSEPGSLEPSAQVLATFLPVDRGDSLGRCSIDIVSSGQHDRYLGSKTGDYKIVGV